MAVHVGGRASPGYVPCSGSLLNHTVWEAHVIKTDKLGFL